MYRDFGCQHSFLKMSLSLCCVVAHKRCSRPEFKLQADSICLILSTGCPHPDLKSITPDLPLFRQAAQIQNIVCLL